MWQVGIVFAALASFCGAAGDALVRLSFVLEAKRRRKQRQLLILRQLQRSGTAGRPCRVSVSTSGDFSSSSPISSSLTSVEGECGNAVKEESEPPNDRTTGFGKAENDKTSDNGRDHEKNKGILADARSETTARSYNLHEEEDEVYSSDKDLAVNERHGAQEEEQQIFIPSRPFYLRPLWVLGTCLGTVINTLLSIISLDFASAAVVTPFAGLHIFWNVIFSRFILQERVFKQHYVGSALVLFGLFFVLCYGAHTPPTLSLQQLLRLYSQNSCVIYFCFSALTLIPCVYIGLFGKDIASQHQREQQQQQQGLPRRQEGRNKVLAYRAVGNSDFSGSLDAEEGGASLSSSRKDGNFDKSCGVSAAGREQVVNCRRRSSAARVKRAVRRGIVLPFVERDEEEEPEGLSGRFCEALPEAGKSFSSFSCDDDESVCSASDSEGCSVRELLDIAAIDTTAGASCTHTGHVHSPAGAAESEGQVASRNDIAASKVHNERGKVLTRQMPASNFDNCTDTVPVGASESCDSCSSFQRELPAEPSCLHFDKSRAYAESERQKRAKQTKGERSDESTGAARPLQRREKIAVRPESQRCLQHGRRSSSSICLAIEISKAEEKAQSSGTTIASGTSISRVDVESGSNSGSYKRQRQQQHHRQLQAQQEESGTWSEFLPAALYVEVPVALRRFCIAAASGACGGNTNIIMEHVMDVWHTESLASLLHPKFFLLLLLLGVMALGQLVFLNLGLARYEALYVVPTTMSVLIISSGLGEISVFIHVLELSQKEFFVFAGGALSIVSGIMVLSAADMERQQESSIVERLKEEDEPQTAAETNSLEKLSNKTEGFCFMDLAGTNKHGALLSVRLPSERHAYPERCTTTSTKCSRTNFSNRDVTDTADEAAKGSSDSTETSVERVGTAERGALDLDATLRPQAGVEAACKAKTSEEKKERRQERSLLKTQKRLAKSPDGTLPLTPDAGIELSSPAHLSVSDSATLACTVTSAQLPPHAAAGGAAASQPLAVTRAPRSSTIGLLAAAAAVPQVLFSRLVRSSSRLAPNRDTSQHSSGRDKLRPRYQRLTRSGYARAAAHASEEEPCQIHPPYTRDDKRVSDFLDGAESSCCTCQIDNAPLRKEHTPARLNWPIRTPRACAEA